MRKETAEARIASSVARLPRSASFWCCRLGMAVKARGKLANSGLIVGDVRRPLPAIRNLAGSSCAQCAFLFGRAEHWRGISQCLRSPILVQRRWLDARPDIVAGWRAHNGTFRFDQPPPRPETSMVVSELSDQRMTLPPLPRSVAEALMVAAPSISVGRWHVDDPPVEA